MRWIKDGSFRDWEAYATTGEFGLPAPARIVFRCRTDPGERPRQVTVDGDKSDAEARLRAVPDAQLRRLLADASELS